MSEVWFVGDLFDLPAAVFLAEQPPEVAAVLRPLVDRVERGMPLTKDEGTRRGPGEWTLFVPAPDRVLTFRCYRKTDAPRRVPPDLKVVPAPIPAHWEKTVGSPDGREWGADDLLATLPASTRERAADLFERLHRSEPVTAAMPIARDHVSATWTVTIAEQAGEPLIVTLTIADPNRDRPGN